MRKPIAVLAASLAALIIAPLAQAHTRMTVARGKAAIRQLAQTVGNRTGATSTLVARCSRDRYVWCTIEWSYDYDGVFCTTDQARAYYVDNAIRVSVPSWSISCSSQNVAP